MKEKKIFRIIAATAQIITSIVFIFSGFVKAVDPLGSTYKFSDYFMAFNMPWLQPAAFPLAILLSSLEFLIGICMLLFILNRLASTCALLFMIIFTPLTLWLALTDPVKDCGCFGDAVILTNWQTFYKNIIISALVILAFFNRKKNIPLNSSFQWLIAGVIFICITGFSFYNYRHLPLLDFRPYKIGASIPEGMKMPEGADANVYEQYYNLKDTLSGKETAISSTKYLSDSTYWKKGSTWEFLSASEPVLIKKGYVPPIHDFSIASQNGDDITQTVLSDTGYYFILVSYDLKKASAKRHKEINAIYRQTMVDNNKFICLTASGSEIIDQFRKSFEIPYDFYLADPITLKTIIRSNPGLLILKNGIVKAKWHNNDIPEYNIIKSTVLK